MAPSSGHPLPRALHLCANGQCQAARSPAVSSHSLKATALSWATKASFDRDTCAILGRHARSVATRETFQGQPLCSLLNS